MLQQRNLRAEISGFGRVKGSPVLICLPTVLRLVSFLLQSEGRQQDKWLCAWCGLEFSVPQHLWVSFTMGVQEACCSPSQGVAITFCKLLWKSSKQVNQRQVLITSRYTVRFCGTAFLLYRGMCFSTVVKRGSSCVFTTFPKSVSAQPRLIP